MKTSPDVADNTIKKLFALSRNRCAFPKCSTAIVQPTGTVTGKICHIAARSPRGPRFDPNQSSEERNSFSNLILLCSVHHDIIDGEPERYTVELLREIKDMHEREGDIELSQEDSKLARRLIDSYSLNIAASGESQVMVGSPGGIQAKTINIKTGSKTPIIPVPDGAIGANIEMRSYVEYLTKRYIEWRLKGVKDGKDYRRFHPSMFHQLLAREFGARPNLLRQSEFERLAAFIQKAIDSTIEGKIQKSAGSRSYHSYEEHLERLKGRPKKRGPQSDS